MDLIIWDLDETLWKGTIYYGEDIVLKTETKEVLKQIQKLGIKQYICSHNDLIDVKQTLKKLDIEKYFDRIYASRDEDKDVIINSILKKTKIKPEETVFIDDIPLNRELVKLRVGCHVDYMEDLYEVMKYFDTKRLILMNEQRKRLGEEKKWKGTKKDFLNHVKNKIDIKFARKKELARIANLANRTNELNANRNRYTDKEMQKIFDSTSHEILVARLSDKFGNYGLVGNIIIKKNTGYWHIIDTAVSCRTMGRGVGSTLMKYLIEYAKEEGIDKLTGKINKNSDNFRMEPLYFKSGFKRTKEQNSIAEYELIL